MAEFQVAAIWWPDGWEPSGPLDVPNCVWQARDTARGPAMPLDQAVASVRGLNRQNMDHPGATWHVIAEAETAAAAAAGGQPVPLRVVRPDAESSKGDCSHCPAHDFPCAAEN